MGCLELACVVGCLELVCVVGCLELACVVGCLELARVVDCLELARVVGCLELARVVGFGCGRVGMSFWRRRIWLVKKFIALKSLILFPSHFFIISLQFISTLNSQLY